MQTLPEGKYISRTEKKGPSEGVDEILTIIAVTDHN
jgi:hypothetical protein